MDETHNMERLRALTGVKWGRFGDDVIPAWVADMDFETAPAITGALAAMVDTSDFGYNVASFDDSVPIGVGGVVISALRLEARRRPGQGVRQRAAAHRGIACDRHVAG